MVKEKIHKSSILQTGNFKESGGANGRTHPACTKCSPSTSSSQGRKSQGRSSFWSVLLARYLVKLPGGEKKFSSHVM